MSLNFHEFNTDTIQTIEENQAGVGNAMHLIRLIQLEFNSFPHIKDLILTKL